LPTLFISYAHADGNDVASRLAADLEASGFDVWWDRHRLKPSASWTVGIEDGIDHADVVLALLSRASYTSDICRAEQLRALRKKKRVLPIVLQEDADLPIHLESAQYLHFYGISPEERLAKLKAAISDTSITASLLPKYKKRYKTFPPLPLHFVARADILDRLRKIVIREGDVRMVSVTAIRGMGGVGKTVLALAICHDEAVQDAFPDGVMWVSVGRKPSNDHLREQIREIAKALGDNLEGYDTFQGCVNQLRNTLSDKSVLIVLDDVWDPRHVRHFNADAPRCRLLITTRNQEVVRGTDAREFTAEVMSDLESRQLLAQKSGLQVEDLPPEAAELVRRSGSLPLALSMIGSRARKGRNEWQHILAALEQGKTQTVTVKLSEYDYGNLFEATEVSVESLPTAHRLRYLEMAVFPPDVPIPQATLATFWDLDEIEVSDTIESWVEASLANRGDQEQVTLHDLQLDYVRGQISQLAQLHRRLLEAYKQKSRNGWASGPNDGYYFTWLSHHLREAGETAELRQLLLNPDWILTKLATRGISDLLTDYDVATEDPDLRILQRAFQLSTHILTRDPKQATSQLIGRLRSIASPEIQALLEKLRRLQSEPWLEPLWTSLIRPGAVLVFTLAGHSLRVNGVAVTSDGRRAVSASEDNTLKLWDLKKGIELHTFAGHSAPVNDVVITPRGQKMISISDDHTVRVWNLENGEELFCLVGHSHLVNAVAVTEDGRKAISAAYDKTLKVWDLETGATLCTLSGHTGWLNAVAVTPDGKRIVSASLDKTLKVWDTESGALLHTMTGHSGSPDAVAVTQDGKKAVSASYDKTLKVWDLEKGTELRTLSGHSGWVNAVAISRDGKRVVSASYDKTLKVWDLEKGIETCSLVGHARAVNGVVIAPDNRRVVSISDDNTLKVWDMESGAELRTLAGHSDAVAAVAITPEGKRVVSASFDKTLKVWDLEGAGQFLKTHTNLVSAIAITRDETRVIAASRDTTLSVRGIETGQRLQVLLGHEGPVNHVTLTPDGSRAVSASQDSMLKVWDVQSGRELQTLAGHSAPVNHAVITSDGKRAVSASDDNSLKVWDLESGKELYTLAGHSGPVSDVAITPDGSKAVSASYDKTLKIWDLESGALLSTLAGHSGWLNAVVITTDGERAVSGSYDTTLRVWSLRTAAEIGTMSGHAGSVNAVAVTADGNYAVSASHDGTLRLWNMENGNEMRTLAVHSGPVNSLIITPDGRLVISASDDNTLKASSGEGQNIATFSADGAILCCALCKDERTIVAGDHLGQIHLLRLHMD
jgi:WD40 repeat protein